MTEKNSSIGWRILLIALLAGFVYAFFSDAPVFAQTSATHADVNISVAEGGAGDVTADSPICRLGVNSTSAIDALDTTPLRLGWYIDYRALTSPPRPRGMNYAPMIRLKQTGPDSYSTTPSGQALEDAILANAGQGATWFIGNEPDRRIFQDDIEPQVYAKAYHELREQIRAIDPTAKAIAGSIVQATEVRMKYLDLILAAHQQQYSEPMAVDAWATHGFILNEVSCTNNPENRPCWGADIPPGVDDSYGLIIDVQQNDDFDIFKANIVRMRQWMADNGYRNVPLYLSEYGVLMPGGIGFRPDFTPERVNAFMTKSFDYLLTDGVDDQIGYPQDGNRLVQYLSWYSTSDNTDFNGYLYDLDNDNKLSPMGENYAAEAAKISDDLDFTPLTLTLESPIVVLGEEGQQKALLVVGVNIANAGNNFYPQSVPVRLYDGDPNTGGLALADGATGVAGCGEESMANLTISVPWDGVSIASLPESLSLYAYVNPDGVVDEVDTSNNLLSRTVSLDDVPVVMIGAAGFLPLVSR